MSTLLPKVLLIDEFSASSKAVEFALRPLDISLVTACTFEAINEHVCDRDLLVLLINMDLQTLDPQELVSVVTELGDHKDLPIIFLADWEKVKSEKIRRLDQGVIDYVYKPFEPILLRNKIALLLKHDLQRSALNAVNYELESAKKELQYIAYHDPLTGLGNRAQFEIVLAEAINNAISNKYKMALLILDLDNFKNLNDALGHKIGDILLREIAVKIKSCARDADQILRIGGDEFAIILTQVKNYDDASAVAKKIMSAITEVYHIADNDIVITASIGIGGAPEAGTDAITLLKNVDIAMYLAKEKGKNNYQFFTAELDEIHKRRMLIEKSLPLAIAKEEFYLVFQPKYKLPELQLAGFEVLLRWEHPDTGAIPPAEFVPIAEEIGEILTIGAWVFEKACKQFAVWRAQGFLDFHLAINLSSSQVSQPDLIQNFTSILTRYHLPARQIEIELTETTLMQSKEQGEALLSKLNELGFKLSIDDFGTGYSSLERLKLLPISFMKIDQTFVTGLENDVNDQVIVRSMISLANSLGLQLVAEGVETQGQLDFLCQNDCQFAQGYLFNKPLRLNEATALLKQSFN